MKVYLDTTVLVVLLFARHEELERYVAVERLFDSILQGKLKAVVSFYAFPELYGYVVDHFPQDIQNTVMRYGFLKLFLYPVEIASFVDRTERRRLARKLNLRDPGDFLHVASSLVNGCKYIVTYDSHFEAVSSMIEPLTPEELLTKLAAA